MNPIQFCAGIDQAALQLYLLALKGRRCPLCHCAESLNRHSFLFGNDPAQANGQRLRGQRVFCSDRGQRGGCGRTFSVFLADVLPRFTFTATLLWQWLGLLVAGQTVFATADTFSPFALETLYHLRARLRLRLDRLRAYLCRLGPAPQSAQADPLLQTMEHFRIAFPRGDCPPRDFQIHFQAALMG